MNPIPSIPTKILVIDDDDVVRLTVQNILKKNGYTVITAMNGKVGVEQFKKENPSIVITDMLMPDKEGLETITDIRAINPNIKIIAMSGGGSSQNMTFLQLAKRVGANQILSKPIKPDQLLAALQALI